ncbi:MAG: ROK family protein [Acidobacteriota bacterium]|nr:ROK family protein [Acidobacteriota bacterium]
MAKPNETPSPKTSTVGVVMAERIYAGLIVDHKLVGKLQTYPAGPAPGDADDDTSLVELPTDSLIKEICELIASVAKGNEASLDAVGIALPGLIRSGVVEEAPNLPQLKGARIHDLLTAHLATQGIAAPVNVSNDADSVAAGLASLHGKLDHLIRVWTLGTGIGYGRYPFTEGVWEGGHTVVSLDDKERFCGCGGRGHLEGIMGHRAMRLRFLDLEPEEVFAAANTKNGDPRCLEFKHLWHKALAAATATSVHQAGPGKFFLTGFNVRFVDLKMLKEYLHQMVKMSPIQGYSVEIVEDDCTTRVIGAAVAAEHAAGR